MIKTFVSRVERREKKYTKSSRSSFDNDSALHMQITWLKNIYSGNTFLNFIALPEPIDSKPYE